MGEQARAIEIRRKEKEKTRPQKLNNNSQ